MTLVQARLALAFAAAALCACEQNTAPPTTPGASGPKAQSPQAPPAPPPMDDQLTQTVTALRSADRWYDSAVGDAGEKTDTYRAYEALREQAEHAHLLALLQDDSPVVVLYALQALAYQSPDDEELHRQALAAVTDDGRDVEVMSGCTVWTTPLAESTDDAIERGQFERAQPDRSR